MRSIIKRAIVIVFYAVLAAVGVNMFLAPSNIFSGGVTGLSQLLSSVGLDFFNINISISAWVLIINLPLAILKSLKLNIFYLPLLYNEIKVVLGNYKFLIILLYKYNT